MKYESITTPNIEHNAANMLAEFVWLNNDIHSDIYPWRGQNGKAWGRLVAIFAKLMREPYGLSAEQLAYYVWQCKPRRIDPREFAKMVAVARRVLLQYDIEQVSRLYQDRRKELASSQIQNVPYKQEKPKSLLTFLRELEREQGL